MTALRRHALLNADLVIAPSRHTARQLAEVQHIPEERIRVLAWPMNPAFLRMADAPGKLSLPRAFPQGRIVLTVGRWAASERYKGADELIHATAHLRSTNSDLHLLVVGDGDDLPRLQKLAADLNVSDCVQFLKNLSREEIAACYSRADILPFQARAKASGSFSWKRWPSQSRWWQSPMEEQRTSSRTASTVFWFHRATLSG